MTWFSRSSKPKPRRSGPGAPASGARSPAAQTGDEAVANSSGLAQAQARYYAAAASWEDDRIRSALVSRNRAYVFALSCLLIAGLCALAILGLTPLKRVEVVSLGYNEQTGALRKLEYTDAAIRISSDEGYIRSQIYNYIMARETWDPTDQVRRSQIVLLNSTAKIYEAYRQDMDPSNKSSIAAELGSSPQARREVRIKTISFLNNKTLHVQYQTEDDYGGGNSAVQEWAVVVGFYFTRQPTDIEVAWMNPFGFQVQSYRRDKMTADPLPQKRS